MSLVIKLHKNTSMKSLFIFVKVVKKTKGTFFISATSLDIFEKCVIAGCKPNLEKHPNSLGFTHLGQSWSS